MGIWRVRQFHKGILLFVVMILAISFLPMEHAQAASGWSVTYYSKSNLTGKKVNARVSRLNYNWGTRAPATGIRKNYFSALFTKNVYEYAGYYDLQVTSNQRVMVYVDGKLQINHSVKTHSSYFHKIIYINKGSHSLRVKYYKTTGSAQLKLSLVHKEIPALPLSNNQWYGEFYPSQNLMGYPSLVGGSYTQKITHLNYNWGTKVPISGIPKDHFSAIFQRNMTFAGGKYHLQVNADNGVRVYVDGKCALNHWRVQPNTTWSKAITLSKGTHKVLVQYFESTGGAVLKVKFVHDQPTSNQNTGSSGSSSGTQNTGSSGSDSTTSNSGSTSAGSTPSTNSGSSTGSTGTGSTTSPSSGSGTGSTPSTSSGSGTNTSTSTNSDSTSSTTGNTSSSGSETTGPAQQASTLKLTSTEWNGAYYPSQDFTGTPVLTQTSTMNYNWGTASPAVGISNTNFSAIFQKNVSFTGSPTDIEVWASGSFQVYLDNTLIINKWNNTNSGFWHHITTPSQGTHKLVIQYKHNTGSASLRLEVGSPYRTLDLRKPSNISAQDITTFFNTYKSSSHLINDAQFYLDAQKTYGINAAYLLAHSVLETGWGFSNLSLYKHNLYGYGAYDVCPFTCGYYFPSDSSSINLVSYDVVHNYLTPGGAYYLSQYGPNLIGMNVNYATDPSWNNSIAKLMEEIKPYDKTYYSSVSDLSSTAAQPPTFGRDIPSGDPLPTGITVNFPAGISATINNDVNFRSLPYVSNSTLIKSLTKGTKVTVLGYNTDVKYDTSSSGNYQYHWYRVSVNGLNGWVYGEYLDIQNLLQVNASGLNIRTEASAGATPTIPPALTDGEYVEAVLDPSNQLITQNGWYQIYVPNSPQTGWVYGDYINTINH